jgi:hypothetical protein
MKREDDFSAATRRALAARVGHVCSYPGCGAPTSGPQLADGSYVTAGDAAHITAASPNGPRYDPSLTPDERRDYANGIWLCVTHARIVDQDHTRYTVAEVQQWKRDAEARALARLGKPEPLSTGAEKPTQPVNAAVYLQGRGAISVSGPNAVVLGPNAINIVGPVIQETPSIEDKWCTLGYTDKAGITQQLKEAGFRLCWARAAEVPELVDLGGWEEVVWPDQQGRLFRFKVRDEFCGYLALLRKREGGLPSG